MLQINTFAAVYVPVLVWAAAAVQLAGSLDTTAHNATSTCRQSGVLPVLQTPCRLCCLQVKGYTLMASHTSCVAHSLAPGRLSQAACRHCRPLMHLKRCVH